MKKLCECGCGQKIIIKPHHKWAGIPRFIRGHSPSNYKDGRTSNKIYKKNYQKKWRENHKEYIAKQKKQYNQEHKEHIAKTKKQYRQDNKEYFSRYHKQWCKDNPDYAKQYRQEHKEHYVEIRKQWRKDNPDYTKRYYQTPIGKASRKAVDHNRRILEKGLTKETVQQVYEDNIKKYGTLTCILCNKSIKFGKDSLEHLMPLSRGGTNDYDNLGIAHRSCNSQKHIMTLEEWNKKEILYDNKSS